MTTYAFSALPYHIVRQVAKYVCENKSELDMDDSRKKPIDPLVALLHICHNWRQVTLPIMFGTGSLCIADNCMLHIFNKHIRNGMFDCIDQSYTAYIQHLSIYAGMDKVINGKSLSILTASKAGGFVFPSLKRVTFCIDQHQRNQLECTNANSNIHNLMQHICQMLPALELINLEYSIVNIKMYTSVNSHTHSRNLVDELSDTLSAIYLKYYTLPNCKTDSSLLVSNLTSLSVSWCLDYRVVSNVIYANSQSLRKLNVRYYTFEGINELVHRHGLQKECMCYPQLAELSLSAYRLIQENLIPPTENAVVFPRLCKLYISFEYPFSDDVLFRENRWTLESIDLVLNTKAIMQLDLDGVFNKGNMIALKNVVIRSHKETTRDAMLNSCSKNFFQGLLSSSRFLTIWANLDLDMLIKSIDCKTQHHKLRCLRSGGSNVSFETIVALLQVQPQLSYLYSAISSVGDKYSGMSLFKMLKHMQANFNPLSMFFNAWSIDVPDSAEVGLVSTCIMLLIDQCPNFHTVILRASLYTLQIKIYEELLRASSRISQINSSKKKRLEFKISFAPRKAIIKVIRNPI